MIIRHNAAGGQVGSCTPWALPGAGQHLLTVGHVERDTSDEIKMTSGNNSGYFTNACGPGQVDEILWTQSASGGCWPFAAFAMNPAGAAQSPLSALAFAHTAYERDKEIELFGLIFADFGIANPNIVYLVLMLQGEKLSGAEIDAIDAHAFGAFQRGFGQAIPGNNKIILGTTTVNAAITRFGNFGEISNAEVASLKRYERLPERARL